jgi:effector-binding domain-containing protein
VPYDIEIKELSEQPVATIRTTTTPDKLSDLFGELLPEVDEYVHGSGIEHVGPPFGIYHEYAEDRVDVEAGMPVSEPVEGAGRIGGRTLPAGRAAVTWHVGPYTTIAEAYRAVEAWIAEQGHTPSGPPWEVYWTDPGEEPDSSKWRTEVGYPIA